MAPSGLSRRQWRMMAAVLVVVVTGVGWAASREEIPDQQRFCAGVGLLTQTQGATPEAAFEAWARESRYDRDDWVRVGPGPHDNGTSYEPRDGAANPSGYSSVHVSPEHRYGHEPPGYEDEPRVYRVTGACVAM